ncbi:hypothetical protein [Chitinophaga sp. LS1]|uniref:hypothetical protein n=1 Tax=Chitinophaga sp. LS1 TaxID=3051176 RepID=UPI002AAAEE7C|nr:hypothetical protein [Chitinophaga sp. LS1]WPV67966.1 hypothetical protein QQL36_04405 [Chitinophaga sp. LS1]
MSFNIMAESAGPLDFVKIQQAFYAPGLPFELVPMPGLGINGGDALGICVPLKQANDATWKQLKPVLRQLRRKFHCDVYELYDGQKLGCLNSGKIRRNLLLK